MLVVIESCWLPKTSGFDMYLFQMKFLLLPDDLVLD